MTEYSDIEVIENDIEEKLEGHSLSAEEKDCEISSKVSVNLGYEYEDINASEGCNKEGKKIISEDGSKCFMDSDKMKLMLAQTKTVCTMSEKKSGSMLGYAFLFTDKNVDLERILLKPMEVNCQDLGEAQCPPPFLSENGNVSELLCLPPASLASDLDISEDSDADTHIIKAPFKGDDDDDVQFICETVKTPNPVNTTNVSSEFQSVNKSSSAQMAAQLVEDIKSESKAQISSSNNCQKETKLPTDIRSIPNKVAPRMAGSYAAFYTDVGVTQPAVPKYRGYRLVRCLLCDQGKPIAVSNFGAHVKAVHEHPVNCDNCGKVYSQSSLARHKKACNLNLRSYNAYLREVKRSSEESVKSGELIVFKLNSAIKQDRSIKVTLKNDAKMKKALKKYAKRCNVSIKGLKLVLSGVELTGEENANELKGREIVVHGEMN